MTASEMQAHSDRLDIAIDLINAAKDETGRVIHLSKLADDTAAAIKAGEARGYVAGLIAARDALCECCRDGWTFDDETGIHHSTDGKQRKSWCQAVEILDLIATEEAARG